MGRVDRPGVQGIRLLTARAGLESFVRTHAAVGSPSLCPEIRLHLATLLIPVWEAEQMRRAEPYVAPPYWAFCWPGGQALARHVLDRSALVRGKRVLDFAAGAGLAGIAAATCGAAEVLAADTDPVAAAAIAINAALNGVPVTVTRDDLTATAECGWDVVLAGDVCYERAMTAAVLPWLRRMAGQGALVLMADPGRNYLPATGLDALAAYNVPTSLELEAKPMRRTTIYRLEP